LSPSQDPRTAWSPEHTRCAATCCCSRLLRRCHYLLAFTAHLAIAHYHVHRDSLRAEVTARAEVVATSAGQLAEGTRGVLAVLSRLVEPRADAVATNDALLSRRVKGSARTLHLTQRP
jgi:hypothetical protein